MGFKIIYEPSGRAKEYADLALNIYTGCSFGCKYCFAPITLKKDRENFYKNAKLRDHLLEKVQKDCESNQFEGRKVLLCFVCDPYQDIDQELQTTREVLKLFKKYGVSFNILTKGGMRAVRDFDLYKPGDSFGSTLTLLPYNQYTEYWEPNAPSITSRLEALQTAHDSSIKTWVSLEPVIYAEDTLELIKMTHTYVDLYKVGTMNYHEQKNFTDWKDFGHKAIELFESLGKKYLIKDDLKKYL